MTLIRCDRQRSYAVGSAERKSLEATLAQMKQELPFEVPCIVNGKPVRTARPCPNVDDLHLC